MFTKINIALSILLATLFLSCGLVDKVEDIDPEKITYIDYAIESVTNVNGELDIETSLSDQELQVLYNLKVNDKIGEPLEGISVVYNQVNGKSVIFIKDKLKRYSSAFLYGSSQELHEIFSNNNSNPEQLEKPDVLGIIVRKNGVGFHRVTQGGIENRVMTCQYRDIS